MSSNKKKIIIFCAIFVILLNFSAFINTINAQWINPPEPPDQQGTTESPEQPDAPEISPPTAAAEDPIDILIGKQIEDLKEDAEKYGYNEEKTDITNLIVSIIKIVLSFVGVIFLILTIISGFQWMMAGGNEEVITKSKAKLKNAIMGVGIIFLAYIIVNFLLENFLTLFESQENLPSIPIE